MFFLDLKKKYNYIELKIVGNVDFEPHEEYYEKVKSLIIENNLEKSIIIKKNLSHQKTLEEYEKSSIFVLPSIKECAGFVVLEAMSYGLPVIVSDDVGLKEYLDEGKGGFIFKKENYKELEEKLEKLIKSPKLRKEFGDANFKKIKDKYLPKEYCKAIKNIKKKLEEQ